ncbi:hypothetical protein BDV93DRAFT_527173 [Ceratobasidium sp. AG-I]|nr:hypothetical protein BDV93DRAFT_527173 [Ceratobasidium sp. AG-I]
MSETQNRSASELCQSPRRFALWARSIQFNRNIWDDLPDKLQKLLAASRRLPNWATDKRSDIYKPYLGCFGGDVAMLCFALARRNNETNLATTITSNLDGRNAATPNVESNTEQDNDAFSADLAGALLPVLTIVAHTGIMRNPDVFSKSPNKATWRTPLENLANFVWLYQGVPEISHSAECRLQLPKSDSVCVPDTQVDSAALLKVPPLITAISRVGDDNIRRAFISPIRAGAGFLLHWATEYAKAGTRHEDHAERRVLIAMVSGLYQRRALGFPSHFVFGTAHSGDKLRVFAGTWALKKIDPVGEDAIQEQQSKKHTASRESEAGSSVEASPRLTKRRMISKGRSASTNRPKSTEDEYEITIYKLGSYELGTPLEVIEYYLLMRASRNLTLSYMAEIGSDKEKKRLSLAGYNPPIDWPAVPRVDIPTESNSNYSSESTLSPDPANHEGSNDLDMEPSMSPFSVLGDAVQEAEWEGEWRASYEAAIQALGHGARVHFSSMDQNRSLRPEVRVLEYIHDSTVEDAYAS